MSSIKRLAAVGLCIGVAVFISGCIVPGATSVSGIKPVYPKVGLLVAKVDSLQPEYKWNAGKGVSQYDLGIWDSVMVKGMPQVGGMIYERTGIAGLVHRAEITLKPDTFYYWSVRATGSPAWSQATHRLAAGMPDATYNVSDTDLFLFFTPKLKELERQR